MNKKKILVITLVCSFCLILAGGIFSMLPKNFEQNSNKSDTAVNVISNDEIALTIESEADTTLNVEDINTLKNSVNDIVIAKVTKIDGSINYNEKLQLYTRINTIGEIKIEQVIKGNLSINEKIPFIRGGGKLIFSQYEKGLNTSQKNKANHMAKLADNEKSTKYVSEKRKDDIEIENGKTYLMFLHYDSNSDKYEIVAQQFGLKEYDNSTKNVKDNKSKKFVSLDLNTLK